MKKIVGSLIFYGFFFFFNEQFVQVFKI